MDYDLIRLTFSVISGILKPKQMSTPKKKLPLGILESNIDQTLEVIHSKSNLSTNSKKPLLTDDSPKCEGAEMPQDITVSSSEDSESSSLNDDVGYKANPGAWSCNKCIELITFKVSNLSVVFYNSFTAKVV